MADVDYRMFVGTLIHALVVIWVASDPHYAELFIWIIPFVILNVTGILLVIGGQARLGAIVFIVGCIPFVPVGLLGILGAKKLMDNLKRENRLAR
ncbi:MAG TPA: hypothetical protein ENI17_04150 [Pseudomonas xinjiangensis]|uniref:Uncharacterized protein n=2 Tax=root TaxID=1 RepID=A0A7V1BME6_9GAMM|nr:hypothetical protein [Halopseudomonas xinjiangensis]HEC46800.1 hypothetical protein [Halopseudomonas xinjiangensis]